MQNDRDTAERKKGLPALFGWQRVRRRDVTIGTEYLEKKGVGVDSPRNLPKSMQKTHPLRL
jgi:hypothetical protein